MVCLLKRDCSLGKGGRRRDVFGGGLFGKEVMFDEAEGVGVFEGAVCLVKEVMLDEGRRGVFGVSSSIVGRGSPLCGGDLCRCEGFQDFERCF